MQLIEYHLQGKKLKLIRIAKDHLSFIVYLELTSLELVRLQAI